ncbi:MAG: hypothetical protein R2939_21705 [Kofleriaceae bacterium]
MAPTPASPPPRCCSQWRACTTSATASSRRCTITSAAQASTPEAPRAALATVVDGQWQLSAPGEAYRTMAPALRGRWGWLPRSTVAGVTLEAFTTDAGERVLAYVNKRAEPVEAYGVTLPARSYGLVPG